MSLLTLRIDVTLLPGTYWIEFFTFPSTNYLGPYVPLTYASQTPAILNFNALQNRIDFVGKWVTISSADDGSDHFEPSALIFDLYGFVIPTTGDSISAHLYIPILLIVLSGGFLMLLIIRRIQLSRDNTGSR